MEIRHQIRMDLKTLERVDRVAEEHMWSRATAIRWLLGIGLEHCPDGAR